MGLVSFILKMMIKSGKRVKDELFVMSNDPSFEQKQILKHIIDNGLDTKIGNKLNLSGIKTIEDFQKNIPLTDYDFYSEDIEEMVKGKTNILTKQDIVHFNVTSGTLGVPKKIPVTEEHIRTFSKYNSKYINAIVCDKLGDAWTSGKGFSLSEGTYEVLPTGVTLGCASSLHTARMGKIIPFMKNFDMMSMMYTSPIEARQPKHLGTYTRYLHALYALKERNITYGNVTFSSYLLEIMRYIENNWQDLCNTIETGKISNDVNIPEDVKKIIESKIKKDRKRALELRKIFNEGFTSPIALKIWPKLEYFICVAGAGFQTYTDKLKQKYLGDNIHILYLGLTASEVFISAPIELDNPDSIIIPNSCFMEFIPIENGERDLSQGIKLLGELEVGKQYELVISNVSGLLRYQLKDVIEVTGYLNKTPLIRFVQRSGYAINMYAEKTSEKALQTTAEQAIKDMNLDMNDYCVCPYTNEKGGKYIFMYELHNRPKDINIELLRDKTESYLRLNNPVYGEVIDDGSCQKMEVKILQEETFNLYKDLMALKGSSVAQLKPVHVTKTPFQERFFIGLEDKEL